MMDHFIKDASGEVLRPAYYFDTFTSQESITSAMPTSGIPKKTQGLRVFSGTIAVPAGRAVEISMSGVVQQASSTFAMAASWFVDEEENARGTMAINHVGAGYLAGIHLHDLYIPDDGLPHTIHINIGPAAGTLVTNGQSGPTLLYGGTLAATFFLKEL